MRAKSVSAFPKTVLYVVALNHFTNDGSTGLIATLFPVVISIFGISKFEVGIMVAVGYIVNMVFQPLTGRFSERYNSRSLLAFGISVIAISMILFTISSTLASMLLTIILLRFGSSFFHPVGVSTISRNYVGPYLDKSMGFQSAFGNLGNFVVFLIAAPVYLAFGWRGPFLVFALIDITTVALTLALLRTHSPQQPAARDEKPTAPQKKYRLGLPMYFITSMLITGGSYAVFVNFGNILLVQHHFGLSLADGLMAGWVASAFFGAFVAGEMTALFGRSRLLELSYFLSALASLGFGVFASNIFIAAPALLVNGFFLSATYPAVYSELSAFLGEKSNKKGSSFGILFSGQIIGSSVLGFLGGFIASTFGLRLAYEIVAALLLAAVGLTALWSRQTEKIVLAR
ncbi:MAG: MFS transporter [Nitrososphaerota archaeon]|nr:MFS transporter [Nitrososphaerota archaeon]